MNKMIKKLTTWMLVFGMTFTPALTSINLMAVNAEDANEEATITIQDAQTNVSTAQDFASNDSQDDPGAAQLIQTAQDNLKKEIENKSGQELLDPSNEENNLSGDLRTAAEAIGTSAASGAQKNLADAAEALSEAKSADEAASAAIIGAANAIYYYVQATDEEGNPLFDENNNPVWEYETDENGIVKRDENGEPIVKVAVLILPTFANTAQQTEDDANRAISTANSATTEGQANAARSALANAEAGLSNAKEEKSAAEQAVNDAQAAVDAAQEKVAEANAKVEAAQAALNKALEIDEDGNYKGNVEDAEAALKQAVDDAEALAGQAAQAIKDAQNANLNLIQEKLDKVYEYVENHPEWTKDSYPEEYKKLARDLCRVVLMNQFYENGIQNAEVGAVLGSIEFITDFKLSANNVDENGNPVGTPRQKKDANGNLLFDNENQPIYETDEDGNILYYLEYEPVISKETTKTGAIGTETKPKWIISTRDNAEDGETNNRIVVKYVVNGETHYKYYNYKANADGSIYIFERKYDIVDDVIYPEVKAETQPAIPAVPESWKDANGNELTETETTHKVWITSEEKKEDGFYAIDTATSKVLKDDYTPDSLEPITEGNKTITYTAIDGEEATAVYTYGSDLVWDGKTYKTGATNLPLDVDDVMDLENVVKSYTDLGYTVTLKWRIPFTLFWIEKKSTDVSFGEALLSLVRGAIDFSDMKLSTNSIPDKTEQSGVFETVTQWFTETTTTITNITPNQKKESTQADSKDVARQNRDSLIAELERMGHTDVRQVGPCKTRKVGNTKVYYYEISYTRVDKNTETNKVLKTLSKKLFAADTYNDYTAPVAGQEEVRKPGEDARKTQKLEWTRDNDHAFEGQEVITAQDILDKLSPYQQALKDLQDQQDKLNQAVIDANAALAKVQKLKEELQKSRNIQLASVAAMAQWEDALGKANAELKVAQDRVVELEELVARARAAVAAIRLPEGDDDDDTPGAPSTTPDVVVTITGEPVLPILPTAGAASAVAGVRVAAGDAADDEGAAAPAAAVEAPKAAEAPVTLEDETLPAAAEATTLEDDDLAGAQGVEEGAMMWWIWLLIVLAAAAGFGVYKYVENKKKANAADNK
ncbi:MAG: hypothetical protein IKS87_09300 [Lachnospiraceae bacterium]|nr:hypothetical protein [Lachnospiraceae bacterium]MBR6452890.1 hypothetical protein [Lachnospiraceae bacterium]